MKIYHVTVVREGAWYAAQALEDTAVITQGRTLDEVIYNVRDAVELLYGEKQVQVELIIPAALRVARPGASNTRNRRAG